MSGCGIGQHIYNYGKANCECGETKRPGLEYGAIRKINDQLKAAHEVTKQVDHPDHYNKGKFEVIDVIEDWKLGFNLGNAIKYLARADHKGHRTEDLKKAIWYIQRELGQRDNVET